MVGWWTSTYPFSSLWPGPVAVIWDKLEILWVYTRYRTAGDNGTEASWAGTPKQCWLVLCSCLVARLLLEPAPLPLSSNLRDLAWTHVIDVEQVVNHPNLPESPKSRNKSLDIFTAISREMTFKPFLLLHQPHLFECFIKTPRVRPVEQMSPTPSSHHIGFSHGFLFQFPWENTNNLTLVYISWQE